MATTPPADERPLIHFSPPGAWINDPNGLVYHDGEYHLFYQHHPDGMVWSTMYWGHAVSRDLSHWQHLPVALAPDELGQIFSGSAVVDAENSAGFGPGALVAVFTHYLPARQVQSVAYSLDRGRSWTKYAGNPVLAQAVPTRDFRDPRVFWFEGEGGGHWAMALAVGREVWFYRSPDLKRWEQTGSFSAGQDERDGVWECPELLRLPVEGSNEWRWVLAIGILRSGPVGGSGTRYFVGSFDGASFRSDEPPEVVRWADHGADFYAAQAWSNAPNNRVIWLAWMSNWAYANHTPASTWRGTMSVPRELGLRREHGRLVLVQRPVAELADRRGPCWTLEPRTLAPGTLALNEMAGRALELRVVFRTRDEGAIRYGLRVRVGTGEATEISYSPAEGLLTLDRSRSGQQPPEFSTTATAPLAARDGRVELWLLVDVASLELFADDGALVLTSQIFPQPESTGVELFVEGGAVELEGLEIWPLEP